MKKATGGGATRLELVPHSTQLIVSELPKKGANEPPPPRKTRKSYPADALSKGPAVAVRLHVQATEKKKSAGSTPMLVSESMSLGPKEFAKADPIPGPLEPITAPAV